MRHLVPVGEVSRQESHSHQQSHQRGCALQVSHPAPQVRSQPRDPAMRRNRIKLFIQLHARARHKVRRRLRDWLPRRNRFMHRKQRLQFAVARVALSQVTLEGNQILIRQFAVRHQHDTLLYRFALHCSTSTSLRKSSLRIAGSGAILPLAVASLPLAEPRASHVKTPYISTVRHLLTDV